MPSDLICNYFVLGADARTREILSVTDRCRGRIVFEKRTEIYLHARSCYRVEERGRRRNNNRNNNDNSCVLDLIEPVRFDRYAICVLGYAHGPPVDRRRVFGVSIEDTACSLVAEDIIVVLFVPVIPSPSASDFALYGRVHSIVLPNRRSSGTI